MNLSYEKSKNYDYSLSVCWGNFYCFVYNFYNFFYKNY